MQNISEKPQRNRNPLLLMRWLLVFYDVASFLAVSVVLYFMRGSADRVELWLLPLYVLLLIGNRILLSVYLCIWRYDNVAAYLRLIIADMISAAVIHLVVTLGGLCAPVRFMFCVGIVNLLVSLTMRLSYRFAYLTAPRATKIGAICRGLLRLFANMHVSEDSLPAASPIRIAIVGAGRLGVSLAEDLRNSRQNTYIPVCFIDINREKIGREIFHIPVFSDTEATPELLRKKGVQEIVFALPRSSAETKKRLYEAFAPSGCKIVVYDYPLGQSSVSGKRQLREFDVEELLFREPISIESPETDLYYRDKVILITGGGGSIGSELCRQIAKMSPKTLVILDVYENGAYDIQQELRIRYGAALDLHVEILSVCDKAALECVFRTYRPQILLHAAAHKHVPLMEHNCVEAVRNNVFGTQNVVELSEAYGVERFIMVSTDKAVNPTNVMGATKRMCEMIVQSHSLNGKTTFSATRFGNVLGSAGSVIPLFRRQIAAGGPLTLTDKRIVRYFMTIPEASRLVLQSGAMAINGELFVLDMGEPVRILDLAENMIRLSGLEPYRDIDIVETGLRPGEKLYEELLIKSETLDKTKHESIFIERDTPLSLEQIEEKLALLRAAVKTGDNETVKAALHRAVPTFRTPEEVNAEAIHAEEMRRAEDRTGIHAATV